VPFVTPPIQIALNQWLLSSITTTSVGSGSWGVRLVNCASLQLARFTTVPAGTPASVPSFGSTTFNPLLVGAGAKGLEFVKEVARLFLSTGGGRASARSEFVLSAPIFTSEVFSFSGMDVHALINKGGLKVRIGLGNELKSPEGDWHIPEDGNKWMYRFFGNGTVRYQDEKKFLGRMNILDLEKTEGRWTREAAAVKVTWPSGTIETWEFPLFDGYQPVTWNRFDGRVQSLIATKWGEDNDSSS
jgi:hypothetical protein